MSIQTSIYDRVSFYQFTVNNNINNKLIYNVIALYVTNLVINRTVKLEDTVIDNS